MSTTAPLPIPEAATLEAARANWRRTVEAELKGASFDKKLLTRTFEGITLQPLYTRADVAARSAAEEVLARSAGFAGACWQVAQQIAAQNPADFNQRLREDLMLGQTAAVLIGKSPVREEGLRLGKEGALDTALAGVELGNLPVHIEAGSEATVVGEAFLAIAAARGTAGTALTGSVTADPLAVWAAAGGLKLELDALYDSLAAWTTKAAAAAPALRTVRVDARQWAEAGGTAVQELACALSATVAYLRALQARGVALEVSVPRLVTVFATGPQFLMETAKFRAWRPLLARVVAALGGEASLALSSAVHAETTRWNKTRYDAHVNMLRVTTEAFAAVLGGVNALHVAPYDEISGPAQDGMSRRIARNIHALLAEEFGATAPADPAGGSWCIESLTDELARKAWAQFQAFEKLGGFAAALRAGAPQKLVAAAALEKAQAVGSRRYGLVGTNLFPNAKDQPLAVAPEAECECGCACEPTLDFITPVVPFRAAAAFEAMRDACAAFATRTGARPRVFLAKIGPVLQHKARADFASGFFAPGGFEMLGKQAFATAAEAAAAAAASGAQIAVLCSTDDTYPELVPAFTAAARAVKSELTLVLAGLPADAAVKEAFSAAGIDLYIHLRASVEETLASLLKKIGAL